MSNFQIAKLQPQGFAWHLLVLLKSAWRLLKSVAYKKKRVNNHPRVTMIKSKFRKITKFFFQ